MDINSQTARSLIWISIFKRKHLFCVIRKIGPKPIVLLTTVDASSVSAGFEPTTIDSHANPELYHCAMNADKFCFIYLFIYFHILNSVLLTYADRQCGVRSLPRSPMNGHCLDLNPRSSNQSDFVFRLTPVPIRPPATIFAHLLKKCCMCTDYPNTLYTTWKHWYIYT